MPLSDREKVDMQVTQSLGRVEEQMWQLGLHNTLVLYDPIGQNTPDGQGTHRLEPATANVPNAHNTGDAVRVVLGAQMPETGNREVVATAMDALNG